MDWHSLSEDYARYHRTRGNRLCHAAGIPLILLAILAWSRWPRANPVPLAALALPVYFVWDLRLGAGMSGVVAALAWPAARLSGGAAAACFVTGWIFQFAGHRLFEGKSPAFLRNAVHLLVGPAWILQEMAAGRW